MDGELMEGPQPEMEIEGGKGPGFYVVVNSTANSTYEVISIEFD